MIRVYVPRDTAACALGADAVATSLVAEASMPRATISMNSSRL